MVERIGSYLPPKFPLFHGWDQQWLNYYWLMLGESGWIFGLKTNMKYSKANIKIIKIVTSRLVLVQSIRAYFDQKIFFLPFFIGTLYFCTLPRSWSLHIFDTIAVFGQKMTFKKKNHFLNSTLALPIKISNLPSVGLCSSSRSWETYGDQVPNFSNPQIWQAHLARMSHFLHPALSSEN